MSQVERKRKSHKKSRGGCQNCKLRRIKCDESKPKCDRCAAYGVTCSYDDRGDRNELHLDGEGAFMIETPALQPSRPLSFPSSPLSDTVLAMKDRHLELHGTNDKYRITYADLNIFQLYQDRTVFTIGTAQTVHIYRDKSFQVAQDNDCMTHMMLCLSIMHSRYLDDDAAKVIPPEKEAFHCYHGTSLFNQSLSAEVQEHEKDALWGTAALTGCVALASIEAETAEESWPLRAPNELDLDWLRIGEGKKVIWELTNPLRENSIWKETLSLDLIQRDKYLKTYAHPDMDSLYPFLVKLYDVDASADNPQNDPYHTAASILVRLLGMECTHATVMYFLSFLGHMDSRYKSLLHQKDPRALLLLAWWYAKMIDYQVWWLSRRGRLECQAICLYLERFHTDEDEIIRLLDYPKIQCGLR